MGRKRGREGNRKAKVNKRERERSRIRSNDELSAFSPTLSACERPSEKVKMRAVQTVVRSQGVAGRGAEQARNNTHSWTAGTRKQNEYVSKRDGAKE
jgi:hypothetical protein